MTPEVTAQLSAALSNLLIAALTIAAGYLAKYASTRQKFLTQSMIQEFARSGIALAEERVSQQVKAGLEKLTGPQKLAVAVDYLASKVPGIDHAEAERIITSELPKVGLGATGFVQAMANAIRTPEGK